MQSTFGFEKKGKHCDVVPNEFVVGSQWHDVKSESPDVKSMISGAILKKTTDNKMRWHTIRSDKTQACSIVPNLSSKNTRESLCSFCVHAISKNHMETLTIKEVCLEHSTHTMHSTKKSFGFLLTVRLTPNR